MNGRVLSFTVQTNSGVISGDDGNRYSFAGSEWRLATPPSAGVRVDFDQSGNSAVGIYPETVASASVAASPIIRQSSGQAAVIDRIATTGGRQGLSQLMGLVGLIMGGLSWLLFWVPVLGWIIMGAGMGMSIFGYVKGRERGEAAGMAMAGIAVNAVPLAIHTFLYLLVYLVWKSVTGVFKELSPIFQFLPF